MVPFKVIAPVVLALPISVAPEPAVPLTPISPPKVTAPVLPAPVSAFISIVVKTPLVPILPVISAVWSPDRISRFLAPPF